MAPDNQKAHFIPMSGHLPVSVYMIWSWNVFASGWFHPGAEDRGKHISAPNHVNATGKFR